MWFRAMIGVACLMLAVTGCIPSKPPADQAEPAAAVPEPQVSVTPAAIEGAAGNSANSPETPASSGDSKLVLDMESGPEANTGVQVSPMEDGKGYTLRGSLGLTGTITRPQPEVDEWVLSAEFAFPSTGFTVGDPYSTFVDNFMVGGSELSVEHSTKLALITIPVKLPARSAEIKKEVTKVPVTLKVNAAKDVQFAVLLGAMP